MITSDRQFIMVKKAIEELTPVIKDLRHVAKGDETLTAVVADLDNVYDLLTAWYAPEAKRRGFA